MKATTTVGTLRFACSRALTSIGSDIEQAQLKIKELAPKRETFPDVAATLTKLSSKVVAAQRLHDAFAGLQARVQLLDDRDAVELHENDLGVMASVVFD